MFFSWVFNSQSTELFRFSLHVLKICKTFQLRLNIYLFEKLSFYQIQSIIAPLMSKVRYICYNSSIVFLVLNEHCHRSRRSKDSFVWHLHVLKIPAFENFSFLDRIKENWSQKCLLKGKSNFKILNHHSYFFIEYNT